jgi:hypothetical protein
MCAGVIYHPWSCNDDKMGFLTTVPRQISWEEYLFIPGVLFWEIVITRIVGLETDLKGTQTRETRRRTRGKHASFDPHQKNLLSEELSGMGGSTFIKLKQGCPLPQ